MVRVDPDVKKAEKNIILFGNHLTFRFYAHQIYEFDNKKIHMFIFEPKDVEPHYDLPKYVNEEAKGSYITDETTKKKWVVRYYDDFWVYDQESDAQQTVFFIGETLDNQETEFTRKHKNEYLKSSDALTQLTSLQKEYEKEMQNLKDPDAYFDTLTDKSIEIATKAKKLATPEVPFGYPPEYTN